MRVLVTGGAGFIGSHVAERLLADGHAVRVLDDLSTGHESNLAGLDVELVTGDVRDVEAWPGRLAGCDAVVHLAAAVSVPLSVQDPLGTHGVNYVATLGLLEALRRHGPARLVYASSAAIYPADQDEPHREDSLPDPSSPYGVDKLAGEYALNAYRKLYELRTTALRFFNIYGERQDPRSPYSGVISIFADRLRAGQGITVYGDGGQSRDFVYVRDLAALIARLVADPDGPTLANVGTGRSTTLLELLRTLEGVLGRRAEVTHAEARPGDIRHSRASVERLKEYWPEPFTGLESGLSRAFRA